jgi:ribosomal protein S18 acetylase RimI-like enzyme
MTNRPNSNSTQASDVEITTIRKLDALPSWLTRDLVAAGFHEKMKPYHDTLEDVNRALDYVFVEGKGQGGFLVTATREKELLGALLMLRTGMGGYIPANILLFVWVDPVLRGRGIGRRIVEQALAEADGDVKLHVEYENPAKRLYERLGFSTKYAEMRYKKQ